MKKGGDQNLRGYLEGLEHSQHVRAYLFDERAAKCRTEGLPIGHAIRSGRSEGSARWISFPAPQVLRDSRASSDGKHRYTVVLGLPPGPRVFIGPRGSFTGLMIAVSVRDSSALPICWPGF